MSIKETLISSMWKGSVLPARGAELADAHRRVVLGEAADAADRIAVTKLGFGEFLAGRSARHVARAIRRMADTEQPGKDTGDATQAPAGESTQPFMPRTEREHWVDIADALNAANAAGMPVGIDMEGILTDHQAWAVVWNRETERWEVGGHEDDSPTESPADAEDWVICCSPSPRCPNGERRARAVERGWTQNGRAGNWLCATHSPSDFFRPDRTYTRSSSYGRTASFRVTHISTPPGGGERMAFGWKHLGEYDAWTDYSSDDFAAWTEVGEVR